jgi:hypothetical protein
VFDVSDGAYHSSIGIMPPDKLSPVAPNWLRLLWQALQWPSPLTS